MMNIMTSIDEEATASFFIWSALAYVYSRIKNQIMKQEAYYKNTRFSI